MTDKKQLGNWGENIAKEYLLKNGYHYLNQNYKEGHLEIDLIFRQKNKTVFVEVKTRTKTQTSYFEEPLNKRQINTLKRAIIYYCLKNRLSFESTRLDLIIILINKEKRIAELKHYQNIL